MDTLPPTMPSEDQPPLMEYARHRHGCGVPKSMLSRLGSMLGSAIFWFVLGCFAFGFIFGIARLGMVLTPLLFLWLLVFPALRQAQRMTRRRQLDVVVDALAQAVRLGMPLSEMLAAMEATERGRFGRHLRHCRELLLQGVPVAVAVEEAFPGAQRHIIETLRLAESAGQLGPALQRLARERQGRIAADPHRQPFILAYVSMYVLCFSGVFALFMIVVVPKYIGIFKDFKCSLPAITCFFIALADSSVLDYVWIIPLVILITYCGRVIWSFMPVRVLQGATLPGLSDHLINCVPLLGRLRRDHALAGALAFTADCTDAGMSLDSAIAQAAGMDVHRPTAGRLRRWAARLRAGDSLDISARTAGLPAAVADLLGDAQRSSTVPQSLRFLGDYYQNRFSRTLILLRSAIVPALTLIFATLTTAVWLMALAPLIRLINVVADTWRHL